MNQVYKGKNGLNLHAKNMQARPLKQVIDAILTILPETDKTKLCLEQIAEVRRDVLVTPSETMYLRWEQLKDVLETNLGNPNDTDNPWIMDVYKIYFGKYDYRKLLTEKELGVYNGKTIEEIVEEDSKEKRRERPNNS